MRRQRAAPGASAITTAARTTIPAQRVLVPDSLRVLVPNKQIPLLARLPRVRLDSASFQRLRYATATDHDSVEATADAGRAPPSPATASGRAVPSTSPARTSAAPTTFRVAAGLPESSRPTPDWTMAARLRSGDARRRHTRRAWHIAASRRSRHPGDAPGRTRAPSSSPTTPSRGVPQRDTVTRSPTGTSTGSITPGHARKDGFMGAAGLYRSMLMEADEIRELAEQSTARSRRRRRMRLHRQRDQARRARGDGRWRSTAADARDQRPTARPRRLGLAFYLEVATAPERADPAQPTPLNFTRPPSPSTTQWLV